MIPNEFRMKGGATVPGARREDEFGPFGPYGSGDADDEDEDDLKAGTVR